MTSCVRLCSYSYMMMHFLQMNYDLFFTSVLICMPSFLHGKFVDIFGLSTLCIDFYSDEVLLRLSYHELNLGSLSCYEFTVTFFCEWTMISSQVYVYATFFYIQKVYICLGCYRFSSIFTVIKVSIKLLLWKYIYSLTWKKNYQSKNKNKHTFWV